MNRRKSIKKDYFVIFSDNSRLWLIGSGLFIILVAAVVWIVLSISNSSDSASTAIASEDIVAVLAMIIIPLALLFATLTAIKKITGFSVIAGVEWIGKKTLAGIDWVIINTQQFLGLETKKTNHRVAPSHRRKAKVRQQTQKQVDVRMGLFDTESDMQADLETQPEFSDFQASAQQQRDADFDFSAAEIATDTGVFDSLETQQADTFAQQETVVNPVKPASETAMELASADADVLPINENTLQTTGGLEGVFNEFETELKSFFPDQEGSSTVTSDQFSDRQNSEGEELYTKQNLNLTQTPDSIQQDSDFLMQEEGTLVNSLDHEQTLDEAFNDIGQDPGVQLPADEQTTKTAKPYTLANDDDFINRALQAAENEALYALDNKQTNDQLGVEERSQKLEESGLEAVGLAKQPDFMIQALQAAKEKRDAENQSNKQQGAEESSGSQQSLFNQAEKTAANIISSFSQRFSKSLGMQLKPAFQLPSISLLQQHQQSVHAYTEEELDTMSRSVERVLNDYKVSAEVVSAYPGPIITRFELSLAPGIKVSRVNGLAKDLARAMLVTSVRVVEIIEGTPYIGLEIPNQERELVSFREIIASAQFQQEKSPITLALGKDVSGQTVVADLGKMPHLLVAGTTGSGKSVAINTMILSMLYKATPDQVRMIMVDPKMLELSIYEGIPHLLTPVVTDMKEAQNALRWAVAEMERRYKLMSKVGVRNLAGFNQKIKDAEARGETIRDPLFQLTEPLAEGESFPVLTTLPSIVIVIDELADMMMVVGKKVEELIARLAQKARAAGIHLILATQRPSVDVLTGLIKANVPTRISFQVSSRIDSRTILDQGGAEALLGNGDMLFLPSGTSVPTRSHGAFVDDHEVHAVVDYLKTQGSARYVNEITQEAPAENAATIENAQDALDELYDDAVSFVMETGRASISSVQRRFKVGYNRAARMIDQMEEENIVSEPEGNGSRRVLDRE